MKPIRKLADAAKSGLRAQNWPFPAKLDERRAQKAILGFASDDGRSS